MWPDSEFAKGHNPDAKLQPNVTLLKELYAFVSCVITINVQAVQADFNPVPSDAFLRPVIPVRYAAFSCI